MSGYVYRCGGSEMGELTKEDIGTLLSLFNRDGYVLDFSTNAFDVFTMQSIGVSLCEKYKLSKGKSLVAYLNNSTYENQEKLLCDLFNYYEEKMEYEYNKDYDDFGNFGCYSRYNEKFAKIYERCRVIIDILKSKNHVIMQTAADLKNKFSSEYLRNQIDLMVSMQTSNPTNAIGLSKELIESCCKTVLEELEIGWNKNDDISQLTNKTLEALSLLPKNIQGKDTGAEAIKAVLGNLRAIPSKLAELRNVYGSGHGKSASFKGLEERHAKLAVGSSITFVDFIWSTYEKQKETSC